MQLTVDISEKYLFFQVPEQLAYILKLNTAIDLYRNGRLSAKAEAKFVGHIYSVFIGWAKGDAVLSEQYKARLTGYLRDKKAFSDLQ